MELLTNLSLGFGVAFTPISVPRKQPTKQYTRFCQVNATPKPIARCCSNSMVISPCGQPTMKLGQTGIVMPNAQTKIT